MTQVSLHEKTERSQRQEESLIDRPDPEQEKMVKHEVEREWQYLYDWKSLLKCSMKCTHFDRKEVFSLY